MNWKTLWIVSHAHIVQNTCYMGSNAQHNKENKHKKTKYVNVCSLFQYLKRYNRILSDYIDLETAWNLTWDRKIEEERKKGLVWLFTGFFSLFYNSYCKATV